MSQLGNTSANTVRVQEQESAAGPRVTIIHRTRALKRADVVATAKETEYSMSMRMINLLVSGTHPGFGMST